MALLVLGPRTACVPHAQLLAPSRWEALSTQFTRDYLSISGASQTPPLLVALGAGMAALKTPSCAIEGHRVTGCPMCSEPFRTLSAALPCAQRTGSTIVCRLSGRVIDEHNPPMVLPSGYVYSQSALQDLAARSGGSSFRDPRTQEVVQLHELRRAFFL
mmetsp:Transcript_45345/g.105891  ORF Transcript_45345/g.105891 Transcript_45345/m.105891 type:complete len:159 (-) Transcript_45345:21-497(-)